MNEQDVSHAALLLKQASEAEAAARNARGADRIDATMNRPGYHNMGLALPKVGLALDTADAETLAVAFETIAKRLRGEAAALLVGPVEVGQ